MEALNLINFKPGIDLFDSHVNHQFSTYFAYKPDPEAIGIDAFSVNWDSLRFYAFPPFSSIARVLRKIQTDNAEGILVVPYWHNQPWFPLVFKMLISTPVLFTSRKKLLHLPQDPQQIHHLWRKIDLIVCHLSSSLEKAETY